MKTYEGKTALVRRLAYVLLYTSTAVRQVDPRVIARGLGVSPRTIARDLEALKAAGWPMPDGRI